ncbi:uncharacterized protein EHS24_005878 [Apiotrichum porosum]|uniref:EF-hand domain-containing protein n=1 Tax=Apiotrichum porosum TaxID=105984 RepID=A0A427XZQ2_9TREE|nr:uncharacterized protein EHS24_005878 [Apiotrichum porosum]RSH84358.1 hypothetical protein EHS24_005878 [Apiotrichum porosum]
MTRHAATLLLAAALALAHGGHEHGEEDTSIPYLQRHMINEHHIDTFDLPSFFHLHDLDMDGFWDKDEIAAVYGLRHHSVIKGKNERPMPEAIENLVVFDVLRKLDTDKDGKISLEEFLAGGVEGLPAFDNIGNMGHHYDEESEYFLHHEEMYHSTPETQTDESYNHPEDIEHFKHHEHIENEEDARQRIFEGLPPNANLEKDYEAPEDPLEHHEHAAGDGPEAIANLTGGTTDEAEVVDITADEVVVDIAAADEEVLEITEDGSAVVPERVGRGGRTNPSRIQEEISAEMKQRHRHTKEERARADMPYKYKYGPASEWHSPSRMRKGLRAEEF